MAMRPLIAAWNRLWFSPLDPRALGWMRISLGCILVMWHLTLWPDLTLLYTSEGPVDMKMLEVGWTPFRWSYLDGLNPSQVHGAHAVLLLVILSFTVGFQARLCNVLIAIALVALWHRSPFVQNGGDRLLRIWVLTLMLVPSGAALSVDNWLRQKRGRPQITAIPSIAHRLIQLQLVIMYTYTGIAKAQGSTWQDGSALYFALSDGSFARFPALFDVLLAQPWFRAVCSLGTWTTLAWEIAFIPLVWFPRTRWVALGLGLAFHVGIFATMSVGVFSFASVWGYQAWMARPPDCTSEQ